MNGDAQRHRELLSICGVEEALGRVATAAAEAARQLSDAMPRPRGAPFFGLDIDADYDLALLDAMSARGIFRKYEFGLDMSCGLGGRARWLATHTGCRVLGVDSSPAFVTAAAELNRRALMNEQVSFAVSRPHQLGLRSGAFSHVWMLDVDSDAPLLSIVGDAMRVLRRGGHFVLQTEIVDTAAADLLMLNLAKLGVVELEHREVTLPELSRHVRSARKRVRDTLKRSWPEARVCDLLWAPASERRKLQIFGRRPA